jgi:ribosomal protein L11 methyltransferase
MTKSRSSRRSGISSGSAKDTTISRTYPALDVIWTLHPDAERLERLLAEIDDDAPTAVEELPDRFRIFFSSPVARGRAAVRVVALEPDLICEPIEVPDGNWAERSQASLSAVLVGRVLVAPPWAAEDNRHTAEAIRIVIQPSMGFGTAHHASTRLCLRMLQALRLEQAAILDVGTGSGVLAIAAARFGAGRVLAIDNDADALRSARENVALNGVQGVVTLQQVDFGGSPLSAARFDIVLANLTGATLTRIADTLRQTVADGGALIASGITVEEQKTVDAALSATGFHSVDTQVEDGWAGIRFTTSPTPPIRR